MEQKPTIYYLNNTTKLHILIQVTGSLKEATNTKIPTFQDGHNCYKDEYFVKMLK